MVFPIVKGYVKQKTNQDEETILSILSKYSSLPALGKNKLIFTRLAASLPAKMLIQLFTKQYVLVEDGLYNLYLMIIQKHKTLFM